MSQPPDQRERLARLLGGERLAGLRARLRRRFSLGQVSEVFTLTDLAPDERAALADMLGLRVRKARSLTVRLDELDHALRRAGLAASLHHALELLDGPIPDLHAQRARRERAWRALFDEPVHPKLSVLLADAQGRGLVKRLSASRPERARPLLQAVSRVLGCLPVEGVPRSQLAAEVLGDAHALDTGRAEATLALAVLRVPEDGRARHTWARAGVLVNEFAKPALAFNLAAEPDTPAGAITHSARQAAEPLHLSLRLLLRAPPRWRVRGQPVFVCENANLLAIAADRLGSSCAALVCTDGMPAASQRTLLHQLADQGAELRYHGDFDWPGLRIGNFILRSFGAVPWRFCSADYEAHPGHRGRPLQGRPVVAAWDSLLAPAMAAAGQVLEEEAVAASLLEDLQQA